MLRVGLTGGLASGKSFIGKALEELGCHVIRADALGHQVLLPGGEAYDAVVAAFGTADRRRLASLVFHDAAKLAKLSSFVHPAVTRLQEQETARITAADPDAIVVVEAAILVETGSYAKFDRLIVAVCTPEQQVERAMKRDSSSLEDVMERISRQLPLEEKRRVAHFVIDTSGTKESTLEQTRVVYEALRREADGE